MYEPLSRYKPGGYHPVHLGDTFHENRFTVMHKLGWGSYSTVWLAKDALEQRYVAMKFIVSRLQNASNEIAVFEHLHGKLDHPGFEYVLGLQDHFQVSGPNGVHDVLVFQVVGPGPDNLREGNEEGEVFVWQRSRLICQQIMLGISFLHGQGIVHGDLHGSNIAFSLSELDGQPESAVMSHLRPPVKTMLGPQDLTSETPRYLVEPCSFKDYMLSVLGRGRHNIKIIDFGEAFFVGHRPIEVHMPLGIRAPEIIFNALSGGTVDNDWGTAADVWSLGCLVYEIVGECNLISMMDDDVDTACKEFIRQIGPLPERWQTLWSPESGKLPKTRGFEKRLHLILEDYTAVTGDDMSDLCDFLRQILVLDPKQRQTAQGVLGHKWLDKA